MIKFLFVFWVLFLSGCTSIPISTMLELRDFNEQSFVALNPVEIRSKIRLSEPLTLDLAKITLSLSLENEKGFRNFTFPLVLENENKIAALEGLFSSQPANTEYTFRLSDIALKNFVETQKLFSDGIKRQGSFSIGASFNQESKEVQAAYISILLQLSDEEGFFTLLDNAEVDFKQKG
ncbi:hypothetical protein [Pseudoalteromonas sp. T1lg23B]|uniref:hypothetical protein n=1 Tax=Pseudoalteromonas sp. T1lg23B TaxID=2077097 RepID=UPI000CF6A996|nr:hypothetical protein [Pseudoalteromonas sp. T1lg23B]